MRINQFRAHGGLTEELLATAISAMESRCYDDLQEEARTEESDPE